MKTKWSSSWSGSTQPRKQRKYLHNAPLHIRQHLVTSNLDKKLRQKLETRSISLRKGDEVKIMRGSLKGIKGKILEVNLSTGRVHVEGQTRDKVAGGKAILTFQPSNLMVTAINTSDLRRFKRVEKSKRPEVKAEIPKKESEGKKEDSKESPAKSSSTKGEDSDTDKVKSSSKNTKEETK
ncbi:TPA: 50S ribosomal protein L24 [archaeon]|jgi:large subunit ribosomal protein L24|uniref:Large ribosomal subunit protein uL24 n=1 Tax=Candidatus Undinarchaeum marinum TaxID=2756141 RepID=A0A832V292_9ARCH|nr:50S ribosomal protein L24 [Candidatus Undinarchaeum marinum]